MDRGAELLRSYAEGNENALRAILDLYREGLIAFVDRYLHNTADAEDIAADAFAELALRPNRYNGSVSLKTYLYMLAKSRALNVLRRRSRRLRAGWEEAERLPDAADTPEEKTLRKERQKQVREALSRLKDDYRTALLLVYEEEMSYEEAGRVMKKTRKQVENLVCRAKNAMKDQL